MNCVADSRIVAAKEKLAAATAEMKAVTAAVQAECLHPTLCEVDYEPMEYFRHLPPRRMCLHCGVEEEGWGCGYKVLADKDRLIVHARSRDEFYSRRIT